MSGYGCVFISLAFCQSDSQPHRNALAVALGDPIDSLYATNDSVPLEQHLGLRDHYRFGFYSFCGSVNGSSGLCSNISAANRFEPFTVILADMPANYSQISESFISMGSFIDSSYLGSFSNGAYYLILIGTVATALALITYAILSSASVRLGLIRRPLIHHGRGLLKHTLLFLLSTVFAVIAALTLLIGATIWTVIIKKAEGINDFIVGQQNNPAPLGITVTTGNALFLVWASWACQLVSILPYMIR